MAWNGSGTFSLLYSWVARRDAGSPTNLIGATEMDAEFANIKTGLENCVTRDGQNVASAALPMGGYAHTNVGAATARSQYARVTEAQDGTLWKAASPGGTIDAMTGTLAPAVTAYAANMFVTIVAPGTGSNTVTNPTINLNSLGAKTIKKHQGALVAGDYTAGDILFLVYDGAYFELLNPKNAVTVAIPAHSTFTTDSTGGDVADYIPFIDTSDGSADNKVLVPDLLTNALASITAKSAPIAADTVMVGDSAASGAVKRSTFTQVFTNLLAVFTAKSTPVVADTIMIADSAASGAPKISTLQQVWNTLTGLTALTVPDAAADRIPVYDTSATSTKYVLPGRLVSGGVLSKTATYAVAAADAGCLVRFSGLAADVELQLPAAATCGDGFEITFRNSDPTYGVTVNPNGSETIDGAATRKTSINGPITLVCSGSAWFTKNGIWTYYSAQTATTVNTDGTLTHNLGATPSFVQAYLVNLTTEHGYAVGDRVWGFASDAGSSSNIGFMLSADSTSVYWTIASAGWARIANKTTNANAVITPANWEFVVVAEAA